MTPISGSAHIAWLPPVVGAGQLPIAQYLIVQNDLVAGTSSQVGAPVHSGGPSDAQRFDTGFALTPSGRYTYSVQSVDTQGNKAADSDVVTSNEVDAAAPPVVVPPGPVSGVSAAINP